MAERVNEHEYVAALGAATQVMARQKSVGGE